MENGGVIGVGGGGMMIWKVAKLASGDQFRA